MRWLLREYLFRIFGSGESVRGLTPSHNQAGIPFSLAQIRVNVGDISAHDAEAIFATGSIQQSTL
jgi:hypothetical protein